MGDSINPSIPVEWGMNNNSFLSPADQGVIHMLLTPFRILRALGQWAMLFILFACVFLITDVGWIFGIGYQGYLTRQWQIEKGDETSQSLVINFNDPQPIGSSAGRSNGLSLAEEFPVADLASLDNNLYSRSATSFHRKSAKMQRAYRGAMYAATDLRILLMLLKQPADTWKTSFSESLNTMNVENPDHAYTAITPGEINELEFPDAAKIKLNHAPVIRVNVGAVPESKSKVRSVCLAELPSECQPHAYYYQDFRPEAQLTEEQDLAVAAMQEMLTPAFWLTAAHENGVFGYDKMIARQALRCSHKANVGQGKEYTLETGFFYKLLGY
jgi:hypothetical protein